MFCLMERLTLHMYGFVFGVIPIIKTLTFLRFRILVDISVLLAPAVTVGETEGAMDSTSVFLASSFAYNFVRK